MVLRAIGPRAGEVAVEHVQLADFLDGELLPPVRRTAVTLAADLKAKQAFDAVPDAVIVRLDDAESSAPVDKVNEPFLNDRANEIVIHGQTLFTRVMIGAVLLATAVAFCSVNAVADHFAGTLPSVTVSVIVVEPAVPGVLLNVMLRDAPVVDTITFDAAYQPGFDEETDIPSEFTAVMSSPTVTVLLVKFPDVMRWSAT